MTKIAANSPVFNK